MESRINQFQKAGVMIVAVIALLSHGAVEGWSKALVAFCAAVLTALWVVKWVIERELVISVPTLYLPVFMFWLISLIQGLQFWDGSKFISLSLDPEATRLASFLLLNLLLLGFIAFNFFQKKSDLLSLTHFLIILGTILSLLSLIQMIGGNSLFFWYRGMEKHSGAWLTGPFVNHNHLAGYLELMVMLPLAFILTKLNPKYKWLYGFSFITMAASIALTASRGGIISFLLTLVMVCLISYLVLAKAKNSPQNSPSSDFNPRYTYSAVPVLVSGILCLSIWIGIEPLLKRLADNQLMSSAENAQTFEGSRGWIWQNSWEIFKANPISGVGIRAFPTAFPLYADSDGIRENGAKYLIEETHNDYLQILTDTGIIGGLLAIIFLLLLGRSIFISLKSPDKTCLTVSLGFTGSIISLLIHSNFDFNLQIPATALLFLIALAVIARLGSNLENEETEKNFRSHSYSS